MIKMDSKGQGALEYLLLIGGAVLIAAIVISVLTTMSGQGKNTATNANVTLNSKINGLNNLT